MEFGVSALKGISRNEHVADFILYNCYRSGEVDSGRSAQVRQNILGRLTTDVRSQFTTEWYTDEYDFTFPSIRLSASGEYWLLLFTPT